MINKEKSFTIIELLVVIAVIGLLAAIVIVATRGVRERAQLSRTASWAATNHRMLSADNVLNLNFDNCLPNTTPTSFTDLSGLNNHGTCTGAQCPACAEGVPGVTGRAVSFDGVDDVLSVPHSADLSRGVFGTSRNFTLGSWVFPRAYVNWSTIINKAIGGFGSHVTAGIWVSDDIGLSCRMGSNVEGNPPGSNIAIAFRSPLNEWTHIACTADGTILRIFINGREVGTRLISDLTHPRSENIAPITIGTRCGACLPVFNGLIDDVRVYSAAVPLSYIQEQYLQGLKSLLANNAITEEEYNQRMFEFNQQLVKE